MADTLVELSTKPWFRKVKQLGLPIPTPQKLKRSRGPRVERALDGYDIMVNGTKGAVDSAIAKAIVSAGAQPHLITEAPVSSAWSDAGEAFGRPVKVYASAPEERVPKRHGLRCHPPEQSESTEHSTTFPRDHLRS